MKLSDKEWRVLNALWVAPEGLALGAVVDALRPDTGWSRSTVLTYLTRMEAKGLVDIRKEDFPHRYRAAVSREDCAAAERRGLLERAYQGSAGKLVAAFLKDGLHESFHFRFHLYKLYGLYIRYIRLRHLDRGRG